MKNEMVYRAEKKDLYTVAEMAMLMWDGHTVEELVSEFETIMDSKDGVIFLAAEKEKAVGFAQCQLRYDYVEGTENSPVGYLEGIFVREEYRKQGYASLLLQACENWAREKGCREFASDCELDNDTSLQFHLKMGFTEVNRIICFCKNIENMENKIMIEKGTKQDKEAFIHFINYVFGMNGVDQSFPKLLPKLYGPQTSPAEYNYLIREQGQIRAAVGAFPLPTIINGTFVNVRGIGNVAVHPGSRGRDYMKAAMRQALQDMCKEDVDYAVLGGRRLRYAHFGFETCGCTMQMQLDRKNLSYVAGKRGSRLYKRQLRQEDTEYLYRMQCWMSEKNTYRCIREENKLYDILQTWEAKCWLFLRENGTLAGYAVVKDHQVFELFAEDMEELYDVLYLLLEDKGWYVITVPPFEQTLAAALYPYCESVKVEAWESYCVFHYKKILNLLLQVKSGYTKLQDGILHVRINGLKSIETLCIQVKSGIPSVTESAEEKVELELTHREAMQLFFQIYAPGRSGLPTAAASWFPLPIWQSQIDGV